MFYNKNIYWGETKTLKQIKSKAKKSSIFLRQFLMHDKKNWKYWQ